MSEAGEQTEEYERFHALKACLTRLKAYLIDSGAFDHMFSSTESFTTLTLSGIPSTHMRYDFQIPTIGRGSIKIQHDEFKNVLNVPSSIQNQVVQYEEEEESSTQSIRIEESLLGVTPSPLAPVAPWSDSFSYS